MRALAGEAGFVFNREAVRNGALQDAAALNQRRDGGADRPVRLVLANAGRQFAEVLLEETSRPGSRAFQAATVGRPLAFTNPYRRG